MTPESSSRFEEQSSYLSIIFSSGSFDPKPRIFSSGIEGPCFIDLSVAFRDSHFLKTLTLELQKIIEKEKIPHEAFCGVIRGGIPLAEKLAQVYKVPLIARLGTKKVGERQKFVSGVLPTGTEVTIVDDVETLGTNVRATYRELQKEGLLASRVVYAVSYGLEAASRHLSAVGLKSYHAFSIGDLLKIGVKENKISVEVASRIKTWQESANFLSSL